MTAIQFVQQAEPSDKALTILENLRSTQETCHRLARHLRGFVFRLEHADPQVFDPKAAARWPSARTLHADLENWRQSRMKTWAWYISSEVQSVWAGVASTVQESRSWYAQLAGRPSSGQSPSQRQSHSPSYSQQYNVLNTQAIHIARGFCRALRQEDEAERAKLRAKPRQRTLDDIKLDIQRDKSLFTKGMLPSPVVF